MLEKLKDLINPKKLIVSLFSEKAVGTLLRHGLNYVGAVLTTAAGLNPELVKQWIEVNYAVGLGVSMVLIAFAASRITIK